MENSTENVINNNINDISNDIITDIINDISTLKIKDNSLENFLNNLENNLNHHFITNDIYNKCKTKGGDTQKAERTYISEIKKVLDNENIEYDSAPSQKAKDIRIKSPKINLECKKTDSTIIMLNDTLPNKDTYYLYIITGNKTYKPQLKIINGDKFLEGNEWYLDYIETINKTKDIFCRGPNKKCKNTALKCYLRPTWSVDLKYFDLLTY